MLLNHVLDPQSHRFGLSQAHVCNSLAWPNKNILEVNSMALAILSMSDLYSPPRQTKRVIFGLEAIHVILLAQRGSFAVLCSSHSRSDAVCKVVPHVWASWATWTTKPRTPVSYSLPYSVAFKTRLPPVESYTALRTLTKLSRSETRRLGTGDHAHGDDQYVNHAATLPRCSPVNSA